MSAKICLMMFVERVMTENLSYLVNLDESSGMPWKLPKKVKKNNYYNNNYLFYITRTGKYNQKFLE